MHIKLKVPDGRYCWKYKPDHECPGPCSYFDNYEETKCEIFGGIREEDEFGYRKHSACVAREIKEK